MLRDSRAWFAVIVALSLSIAGLVGGGSAVAQRAPALVSAPDAPLGAARPAVPLPGDRDVRYRRSRHVTVDVDLLRTVIPGTALHFPAFADAELVLVIDRVIAAGRDEQSYVGHVAGMPLGSVLLERVQDVVVGAIRGPGSAYAVQYAGRGIHVIHDLVAEAFRLEHDSIPVGEPPEPGLELRPLPRRAETLRYLGLFTNAARRAQGSKRAIKAAVRLTVTWFNAAAEAQGVEHRMAFAGVKKVRGPDNGDLGDALDGATFAGDGLYDQSQGLRDAKRADFVGIYIAGSGSGFGTCGLGWRPTTLAAANERWAYSSVREDCNVASAGLVGAHEMLHNIGGCHPTWRGIEECASPVTRYSYGYVAEISAFEFVHTTLGTAAVCRMCDTLLTISGKRRVEGVKPGNNRANMAKLINRNADLFAAYR